MSDKKIIVLDLDGTLTNDEKIITEKTFNALMDIQKRGVKVALASGRPTHGMAFLADCLKLDEFGGYVLAYNGGEIIDWKTKEPLRVQSLDKDVLPLVCSIACEDGQAVMSYDGADVITETPGDEYVRIEARINRMNIRKVGNLLASVPEEVRKFLICGNPETVAETERRLVAAASGRLEAYRSQPFFIEVVPPGIDKAASLDLLLTRLGMGKEDAVAVGDSYNDLSMVKYAGVGVAMSNACDGLKEVADYVTVNDNNHDGIAEVIKKYF